MSMRILVIGGTGFIGGQVVRLLTAAGHKIAIFHRGRTPLRSGSEVVTIQGDRRDLPAFRARFAQFAPDVILDAICYTEGEAAQLVGVCQHLTSRLVILSSADVYRNYDGFRGVSAHSPDPTPLNEDAPLRQTRYPYRERAAGPNDWLYWYDKVLVEQGAAATNVAVTILRLPAVYGPGDRQHRVWPYLARMDDGRSFILLENGQATWRWTRGFVDDVAASIVAALLDPRAAHRTYNCGQPGAFPERQWVALIGRAAGWSGTILTLPNERLPTHLKSSFRWRYDLETDTLRVRSELGVREHRTVEEGLRSTIAWERDNCPRSIDVNRYRAEDAAVEAASGL